MNITQLTQSLLDGPFHSPEKALEGIQSLREWILKKTAPGYVHPLLTVTLPVPIGVSQAWVPFQVGDIVILKDHEKSGHFLPLPGAPAMVADFPKDLQLDDGMIYDEETSSWGCEDMIIITETPTGIQSYCVSSRDFQRVDVFEAEVPAFVREGILAELELHEKAAQDYMEKQKKTQEEMVAQMAAQSESEGPDSHCGEDATHDS